MSSRKNFGFFSWDGGIEHYSGLLDVALAGGFVTKPSNGWYQLVNTTTGEEIGSKVRQKDTLQPEFWTDLLANPEFQEFVTGMYSITGGVNESLDLETEE